MPRLFQPSQPSQPAKKAPTLASCGGLKLCPRGDCVSPWWQEKNGKGYVGQDRVPSPAASAHSSAQSQRRNWVKRVPAHSAIWDLHLPCGAATPAISVGITSAGVQALNTFIYEPEPKIRPQKQRHGRNAESHLNKAKSEFPKITLQVLLQKGSK